MVALATLRTVGYALLCAAPASSQLADPAAGGAPNQAAAQEPARAPQSMTIEIAAGDPPLEGHGPAQCTDYAPDFSGSLYVWATSATDLFLSVTDSAGKMLASDEDSGGSKNPFVSLEVEPGHALHICVAASKPDGTGRAQLQLALGPESAATRAGAQAALDAIGEARRLRDAKDLAAARAKLDAALAALDAVPGGDGSARIAAARVQLGDLASELGDVPTAAGARSAALRHYSARVPGDQPGLQQLRANLALSLRKRGDTQGARALQEQVLEVRERTLPADDSDLQLARMNLAVTMKDLGDTRKCRALLAQALEVWSRTLPAEHSNLLAARMNYAVTCLEVGELQQGREMLEQVLAVRSRLLADDDPGLQRARTNLAVAIWMQGDYESARPLQEKVLEVLSRTLPDEHPDLQLARINLAATMSALGDRQGARALLEKALAVSERTLPQDHPQLQRARGELASTLGQLDDFAGARALQEKVLAVFEAAGNEADPLLQIARQNLALTLARMGELERARGLLETALARIPAILSEEHTASLETMENLSSTLARMKERREAVELATRMCAVGRASIGRAALSRPPREAEMQASSVANQVSMALSISAGYGLFDPSPELDREAFAWIECLRGVGLCAGELQRLDRGDPLVESAREPLRRATEELVRVSRDGDRDSIAAARREVDRLSTALVAVLAGRPGSRALVDEPDAARLAQHLPPDAALVAFWRYWKHAAQGAPAEHGELAVDCLVAFVLRPDGKLARIELGPRKPLVAAIDDWRTRLAAPLERGVAAGAAEANAAALKDSGERLRRLAFDPLLPALGDARRVIVELDDELHAVPLDALPDGPEGKTLVGERFRIELLPSSRELLAPDPVRSGTPSLVACGGASFDAEPQGPGDDEGAPIEAASPAVGGQHVVALLRGGAWERGFEPLTFTSAEARSVAALFREAAGADALATVLEGRRASRASLEELAPAARFVHIATHGWFAPESVRSASDARALDAYTGSTAGMTREEQVRGSSPMVLCGLAFAGANLAPDALGRLPGLVTAEEISSWDLARCELVVLSACDTNVGLQRAGQGVASLQKALHMAGARSVITSLWKVSDEATKDLMLDLYRRMWIAKVPVGRALWEAKLRLRDARDSRDRPKYTARDWAGWVLSGDAE